MFHSERAMKGTSTQINNIIKFLESQLKSMEKERLKYKSYGSMGKFALNAVEHGIIATETSLTYYLKVRDQYTKDGLI